LVLDKRSKVALYEISLTPIDGKNFKKGALESPYCSIKLRVSVLPSNTNPNSSATSRSSQFAFGKSPVIDFNPLRGETCKEKSKSLAWENRLWKL